VDWEALRVTAWTTSTGMEGVGYTITNSQSRYELPQTGGMGMDPHYAFGILLVMAAVLMYTNKFGRKRQEGGKCAP
jgi:hypothetical protein